MPHFLSADGRYVAFGTDGTNVDPADTDTAADLYIRDVQAGDHHPRQPRDGSGRREGQRRRFNLALSGDAHYAAFFDGATNLSPDDTRHPG